MTPKQSVMICMTICLLFLLCGCSREMPQGETRLPLTDIEDTTEATEAPTIPADWNIPDDAVYCQIELMSAPVSYHFYDAHDNEILAGYPDISEDHAVRTHYTYGDDGSITYRSVQDHFETSKERYVYNKNGTVKQCFLYDGSKADGYLSYSYDKHGQMTKEAYIRLEDHVCMYETRYQNSYDDNTLICQKERGSGALNTDTYYEYDTQGNVIHETVWSPVLGDILMESRYTYDDSGRLLTAVRYGDDITLTSRYAYVDLRK